MLLLAAVGAVLYVAFLGLRDLWYPDEPDIAEVCRAMFLSGDWISPRRNGVIWIDYQPLVYWTACITSHLFGVMNEFTLRLPSALAGIATALLPCHFESRWFDPRTVLWAGLLLLTFQQYAYNAVSYRPDQIFTLAVAAALLIYSRGCDEQRRWGPRVVGYAFLGVAFLAKGALGLLLPGLVLTLWHVSRREWRLLLEMAPLTLVALAVALPWNIAVSVAMGGDNFFSELIAQNFHRFHSGSRGHERPLYYYLERIWADLAPWSVFLPFAVWWVCRGGLWRDRNVQLALWWSAAFFVVLSIAVTKRQLYMLPAYPAMAILMAPWMSAVSGGAPARDAPPPDPRPARVYVAAFAIVLPILGGGAVLAALGLEQILELLSDRLDLDDKKRELALSLRAPLVGLGAIVLGAGIWIIKSWRRGDVGAGLFRIAAANLLAYIVLIAWLLPALNPVRTYAPQGAWIREQIGDETVMALADPWLGHHKMGAFGYYSGALVALPKTEDEIDRFLAEHPTSLAVVHPEVTKQLMASDKHDWKSRFVQEMPTPRETFSVFKLP